MSEQSSGPASGARALPDAPNLDWLRKQAKRRLDTLRATNPDVQLSDAQFDVAKEYGFASWRALKAHIDSMTVDGQLFASAERGDVDELRALLEQHPERLYARKPPYEWTLLHVAAHNGRLAVVDLLLERGLDANVRERGDNTYAMHWAAAAAHLDVVRRLADAGGDVTGLGDDHQLEVIGWATCWDGSDDAPHRAVADFLVSRGARHHIFSAIAMNFAAEVRRIVAEDPSALNVRMSRNESHATPLHFAVRMKKPEMVALLLELGADPLAVDGAGHTAASHAETPEIDRPLMEAIRALTRAELVSADRGGRRSHGSAMDLGALVSLGDWEAAERVLRDTPELATSGGVLHLMAKRNDLRAVKWLLDHGANPNAIWSHWGAEATPLHLAAMGGHADVARVLLAAGADPTIRDSQHNADVLEWAEFFGKVEIVAMIRARSQAS